MNILKHSRLINSVEEFYLSFGYFSNVKMEFHTFIDDESCPMKKICQSFEFADPELT